MKSSFYKDRALILKKEEDQYLGSDLILSWAEESANEYLLHHKYKEVEGVFDYHNTTNPIIFPPSQNFLTSKPLIEQSVVFQFIANLPKGMILQRLVVLD